MRDLLSSSGLCASQGTNLYHQLIGTCMRRSCCMLRQTGPIVMCHQDWCTETATMKTLCQGHLYCDRFVKISLWHDSARVDSWAQVWDLGKSLQCLELLTHYSSLLTVGSGCPVSWSFYTPPNPVLTPQVFCCVIPTCLVPR